MADIPDHLTAAFQVPFRRGALAAEIVAAVLAALRPDDARLVPPWEKDRFDVGWQVVESRRERDEARAETGRLLVAEREMWTEQMNGYVQALDEARAEVERLKAENERLRLLP